MFDQTSFDPTTYTLCHHQSETLAAGETKVFTCDQPIRGRYVTIHFPITKDEVLTLCEVVVYEYVGKFTSMSPNFSYHGSIVFISY